MLYKIRYFNTNHGPSHGIELTCNTFITIKFIGEDALNKPHTRDMY